MGTHDNRLVAPTMSGGREHDDTICYLSLTSDDALACVFKVNERWHGVASLPSILELCCLDNYGPPFKSRIRTAMVEMQVAVDDDFDRINAASGSSTGKFDGPALCLVMRFGLGVHSTDPGVEHDCQLRVNYEVPAYWFHPGLTGVGLGSWTHDEAKGVKQE